MKIALSTNSIVRQAGGGLYDGIGHCTHQLYTYLKQTGHHVTSFAFPALRGGGGVAWGDCKPFPYAYGPTMTMALLSGGRFPRFRWEADIMHFTDCKMMPCALPSVVTLWDAIPLSHPSWSASHLRHLIPSILRKSVQYVNRIVTGSAYAAETIQHYYRVPEAKIQLIPWGINATWFLPVDSARIEAVLARYNLKAGFFLTVGTIQPRKNIALLVEAFQKLPSSLRGERKLVIVGRYGWGCPSLLAALKQRHVDADIIWLSDVASDLDLRCLYRAAGVLLFPSLNEGFGLPALEAFASETPVIASNQTAIPEVTGGAALLVDPHRCDDWVDAMQAMTFDQALQDDYRARGLKRAKALPLQGSLKAMVQCYRSLI